MRKGRIKIDRNRCKGCMLCIDACPKGEIKQGTAINKAGYNVVEFRNNGECNACMLCAISCPDAAIEVIEIIEDVKK
ncbi:MAG: ferredoxin family protein [Spirochaetia bacterium]|nr:ferredoxin family protein [Spirochaetia bacterium]